MTDRPAIKPLEWKKIKVDGEIMFRARKPFGSSYYITELLEAYDWNGQTFDTIEAAKAAAQADYESRIRSCLLDKPEAVEGVATPSPQSSVVSRWCVFEDTMHGYWGIEADGDGDADPILYPIKINRERLDRIVDAHNAEMM